jgi:pimeloyl-ACP methyl ester carboxylesterase
MLAGVLAGAITAVGWPAAALGTTPEQPQPAVPALTWAACPPEQDIPARFRCATAKVPLDHRRPGGPTISLALVRHAARKPESRLGSLFMNPGGPGGSAVDLVVGFVPFLPAELLDRFDIVGFDPRGVARSGQVRCWNRQEYDAAFAATRVLQPPSFRRALSTARSFVDACVQRSGELLPYVGTEYVARDTDLIRAAVGDDRLTYLGFSFGTFIGTVYANLFPDRVRALALDGAYDPRTYARRPYQYDRGQFVALERSLSHFLAWCTATPASCGFGDGNAEAAFDELVAELDAHPRTIETPQGRGTVNAATMLLDVAFMMNNGRAGWPSLGKALAQAQRGDADHTFAPLSTESANFFAANTAVECADRDYPRSLGRLEMRLREHARLGGRTGPLFAYGPPGYDHSHAPACVQWPEYAADDARSRYEGGFSARGAAPILVIGTTGDPDTPYSDAVALARILHSATLLTFRGEGHTGFARSPCVTHQVVEYLVDLTLPQTEVCDDEPPPERASARQAALASMAPTTAARRAAGRAARWRR